ncbi:MAG: FAD-binding oxidoreductase, partial [Saprospiraceae bacterium]|nr:FAD-binding oxidoreductase [Saprospiraceae bacterium]
MNLHPHLPSLSFWEHESFFSDIDLAIIGSGLVGLSAAITAKERHPDWKVVVFERGPIPVGASTRNAGFACFGSLTELLDDLETMTEQEMMELVQLRYNGLQKLRSRVGDATMDFKGTGNFEIFRKEEGATFEKCLAKLSYFNELMESVTGLKETYTVQSSTDFPFSNIEYIIKNNAEGQIHTGKMMNALLEKSFGLGIRIYNGISIADLKDNGNKVLIKTEGEWDIKAAKVVVATNGFARYLLPDQEVNPARNQVLITEPIKELAVNGCFHYDKGYVYFRNVGNRILLGGARNQFEQQEATVEFGNTPNLQQKLLEILEEVILPGKD